MHEKIKDFNVFEYQWRHNKEYALVNSPRVAILGICGGKDSERSDIKSAEQVYKPKICKNLPGDKKEAWKIYFGKNTPNNPSIEYYFTRKQIYTIIQRFLKKKNIQDKWYYNMSF